MRGGRYHQSTTAGGPVCILCRQPGHIAKDCPTKSSTGQAQERKRAFGSYAYGMLYADGMKDAEVLDWDLKDPAILYWWPVSEEKAFVGMVQDQAEDENDTVNVKEAFFSHEECRHVGIWDGGATMTAGSYSLLQDSADLVLERYGYLEMDESPVKFTFAGGEESIARSKLWLPLKALDGRSVGINTVPNDYTPILLGLDTLVTYGMVLDYSTGRAYSRVLEREIPTVRLSSGHLAVSLMPPDVA